MLQALGASQDVHSIAQAVDKILLASYGVRRGNKFVKSKEITDGIPRFRGIFSDLHERLSRTKKFI